MQRFWRLIYSTVKHRFDLTYDQADEANIFTSVRKSTEFKGANLWALIFAIFIASIGLNVNATAVIIGAMLISPLMGPIMGVGFGLGIYDFELVKKSLRNLLIATAIGIITSTLYFFITPLHAAQSELLARTTPTIWDVFIAFFGGLAGMVGTSRKEKGNVIPGVAIATALMPPLCTAGFGIATGNLAYFLGAIYLYSINSVFICYGTIIIVRLLKFERRHFADKSYENKISRTIYFILIITTLPSIYLGYKMVDRTIFESNKNIFENNAQKFVHTHFQFNDAQVVKQQNTYSRDSNKIELLMIGEEIPKTFIDSLAKKMPEQGLKATKLIVKQGLSAKQEYYYYIDSTKKSAGIAEKDPYNTFMLDISGELKALFPTAKSYAATNMVVHGLESTHLDSITVVLVGTGRPMPLSERGKLSAWLKSRLKADSLKLIVEQQ